MIDLGEKTCLNCESQIKASRVKRIEFENQNSIIIQIVKRTVIFVFK